VCRVNGVDILDRVIMSGSGVVPRLVKPENGGVGDGRFALRTPWWIDAITAVVHDFRDRVAGDARINQKFARTDLGRLTKMLIDQVCEATGGPCKYTGRSMKEAHAGMKVTTGEFSALVDDLVATLNKFKVGKGEEDELLGVLGPLMPEIVEVKSDEVGTPLPSTFQAAPALMK
jgi:hemoglobin